MSIKITSILLIIFIANTFGTQTIKWNDIKKELPKYNTSLLNDEIITDLKLCYQNNTINDNYPVCSYYFDLILQINKTELNLTISPELINKELEKPYNITKFCDRVTHSIPDNNLLKDYDVCTLSCVNIKRNELHVKKTLKTICKMIDFMASLLTNNSLQLNNKITDKKEIIEIAQPPTKPRPSQQNTSINIEKVLNENAQTNKVEKIETVLKHESSVKLDTPEKTQSTKTDDNKSISKQPAVQIFPPKSTVIQQAPQSPPLEITKKDDIKENSSPNNVNTNDKINPIIDDTNLDNGGNVDDSDREDDIINYEQDGEDDKLKVSVKTPIQNVKENINDVKLQENSDTTFDKFNDIKNDFGNNDNKVVLNDPFYEKSGSNFFTYLLIAMFGCILLYVAYHNKTKILALLLEGRRGQKGRSGRRKHTAAYRKLDSNLEEAISSPSSARSSQIIY